MIADVMDYKFLSNVEKLPKRRIGDIALIKAGGDCPQEWSKYKTKDYQIPIYSNGTDNEGLYGYTKEPVILKRSVTVAARGTIGYCEIREGGYVPIIRLLAVTPNDIGGDVYLHQVFNRIKFKNDGSIQQQLTVPSIASIEIPYPDASALKTFANITYPFIEKIKLNKIQIEELTKQRDKLLPLLMNGQVSVNSDLSKCISKIGIVALIRNYPNSLLKYWRLVIIYKCRITFSYNFSSHFASLPSPSQISSTSSDRLLPPRLVGDRPSGGRKWSLRHHWRRWRLEFRI